MKILNLYAGIGGNRKLWKINRGDEIIRISLLISLRDKSLIISSIIFSVVILLH